MQRPQGRQRLVRHLGAALIHAPPYLVRLPRNLAEKRPAQPCHFIGQPGFHYGLRVCVLHQRRDLVHLPAHVQAGAHIVRPHNGIADDAAPLAVLGNPRLDGAVIVGKEVHLGFLELRTDARQLAHDVAGLFFGNGPAGQEADAVAVKVGEGAGLERAENAQVLRVGDALGTKGSQILRGQFRAAQVFGRHLSAGRPQGDVEIEGQQAVQNADVGLKGGHVASPLHAGCYAALA